MGQAVISKAVRYSLEERPADEKFSILWMENGQVAQRLQRSINVAMTDLQALAWKMVVEVKRE